MYNSITDYELIRKVTARDSKALEALYDKYSPILFTLVNKIVGSKEKAEIVLTEIFVIIWRKSELFNPETRNLFVWLVLLSRNKALDFIRRERGEIITLYSDEYENDGIIPRLSPSVAPLEIDEAFDKRERICSAVNKLTEAQQYVLALAYYEGLNEAEIARKLNIPLPTIKSKLRVVLNSIKESVTAEGDQ